VINNGGGGEGGGQQRYIYIYIYMENKTSWHDGRREEKEERHGLTPVLAARADAFVDFPAFPASLFIWRASCTALNRAVLVFGGVEMVMDHDGSGVTTAGYGSNGVET
jgi:hypothetical protein